jgi:hypothetical protein
MSRRRKAPPSQHRAPIAPTSAAGVSSSQYVGRVPAWHWFLLSATLPLVLLASKLNLDLWHDEIYTVTEFVARGPRHIVTDYSAPNNHVFYSLVLWPFYYAGDSSFTLRLPSLACATGTLWFVFKLAHRFAGLPAAIAATAILGLNPMFLVHAIQVRGYSLSMMLCAWLADLALAETRSPTRLRLVAIALAGAAFLYVVPTNMLFLLPLAAVAIIWNSKSKIAAEACAWLGALLLAAVCYAPIYRQVLEHGQPKGALAWSTFWLPASAFFSAAGRDAYLLVPLWLAGVFCWIWRVGRRPMACETALPLLCFLVVTGAFVLTGLLRISPFTRNYAPLLPIVAVGGGWSLAELLEAIRRRWWAWLPAAVSGAAGLSLVLVVLVPSVVTYPRRLAAACRVGRPQDGYFNYYAADYHPAAVVEALAEWTQKDKSYSIVYAKEDHWNLAYYLGRAGLPPQSKPARGVSQMAVYVVATQAAQWRELAAQLDIPEDELRGWPMLRDFGYYRVFRSPKPSRAKATDSWPIRTTTW